jgi:hypothetical protein
VNANGLVEIAINKGNAADALGIGLRSSIGVGDDGSGSGKFR